ncbi:MAG TPA: hypothetical protein VGN23_01300 [Verrucomicrobiae bacterium]|jgi:ABC-type uncharacterized transport system permease subunit
MNTANLNNNQIILKTVSKCLSANTFKSFAGAILFFLGAMLLIGGSSPSEASSLSDPVFNLPFNTLMLLFGGACLAIAFVCLFLDRKTMGLLLTGWLSAILIAYRIGLWTMDWRHSDGFMVVPLV